MITADLWKLGQLRPGDRIQFRLVSHNESIKLLSQQDQALTLKQDLGTISSISPQTPEHIVSILESGLSGEDEWIIRQSGDQTSSLNSGIPYLTYALGLRFICFINFLSRVGFVDHRPDPGNSFPQVHFDQRTCSRKHLIDWVISKINLLSHEE